MTTARLDGKRIAILATDGVEQTELVEPREMLLNAGATALLVSPRPGTITAFRHEQKGKEIQVDVPVASANAEAFDALVLPGGVFNADRIRASRYAVDFVRDFAALRRPIAAIGHAPWLLIEADEVHGRTLTSFPSLKTDLRNAGAIWVDRDVMVDGSLITSRRPEDLPAFCARLVEDLAAGELAGAAAGPSLLPHLRPRSGSNGRYGSSDVPPLPYHSVPVPASVPGGMRQISPFMRQR